MSDIDDILEEFNEDMNKRLNKKHDKNTKHGILSLFYK